VDVAPTGRLPDSVPRGRHLEWRATLQTSIPTTTPTLRSIQLAYEH
jgi:hypothetical protein